MNKNHIVFAVALIATPFCVADDSIPFLPQGHPDSMCFVSGEAKDAYAKNYYATHPECAPHYAIKQPTIRFVLTQAIDSVLGNEPFAQDLASLLITAHNERWTSKTLLQGAIESATRNNIVIKKESERFLKLAAFTLMAITNELMLNQQPLTSVVIKSCGLLSFKKALKFLFQNPRFPSPDKNDTEFYDRHHSIKG
jgi:hypothetical protein